MWSQEEVEERCRKTQLVPLRSPRHRSWRAMQGPMGKHQGGQEAGAGSGWGAVSQGLQ